MFKAIRNVYKHVLEPLYLSPLISSSLSFILFRYANVFICACISTYLAGQFRDLKSRYIFQQEDAENTLNRTDHASNEEDLRKTGRKGTVKPERYTMKKESLDILILTRPIEGKGNREK